MALPQHTVPNRELPAAIAELAALLPAELADGLQLWTSDGQLLYSNPASARQLGVALEQAGGSSRILPRLLLDSLGRPLEAGEFPVNRVLDSGLAAVGVTVRTQSDRPAWLRISAYPVKLERVPTAAVLCTLHDLTDLWEKGRRLELDAHYDALTGLPNRLLLADRMGQMFAHSRRKGEFVAVCLMDLDGFKSINDSMGHESGDLLLRETARRLLDALRAEDTAVRLGGDEFVLLIGGFRSEIEYERAVRRILSAVSAPMSIAGQRVLVTASIGVTLYPSDRSDADTLIRHADRAMYRAKETGKNRFHLFDPILESRLRANESAKRRIAMGLERKQFRLLYQPKIDCRQGRVIGCEALLRWEHPILGTLSPGEFLPLIERDDLIIQLGNWVIDEALRQASEWRDQGIELQVSVNIAARHIQHGGLAEHLCELASRYPEELIASLQIEILETTALEDVKTVESLIRTCRTLGISFALDDFGTGYSSLAHLKHLGANLLKIDKGFVREMLDNPDDLAIIQGIVGLAAAFQRETVAEGVETVDQVLALLEIGCWVMQGFGLGRPMAAAQFPAWIARFVPDPRWRLAHTGYPLRSDFDLLLMEVTHRNWLNRVQSLAADRNRDLSLDSVRYEDCRLTKWFSKIGRRRYGNHPQLYAIDELHRDVHRVSSEMLDLDRERDAARFEALHLELIRTSALFVDEIRKFRYSVATF